MKYLLISLQGKEFPVNNHFNILKAIVNISDCLEVELFNMF